MTSGQLILPLPYSLAWSDLISSRDNIAFSISAPRDYKGLSEFTWRDYSFSQVQCVDVFTCFINLKLVIFVAVCALKVKAGYEIKFAAIGPTE